MAIRLERQDAVATIVMDRPEARNAVDGPGARAARSARAPISRRAGPNAGSDSRRMTMGPWGRAA